MGKRNLCQKGLPDSFLKKVVEMRWVGDSKTKPGILLWYER